MPPRYTNHLLNRLRERMLTQADVDAVLHHPYRIEEDPDEHSVLYYGRSGDGRTICVAVTE